MHIESRNRADGISIAAALFGTLLILLLVVGMTTALPAAHDISVQNIEITQAVQTTTNTVPLVAQRSTAVRVTVGIAGDPGPVPNVSGRLHVFVNNAEITPAAGLLPINTPFTAPVAPQRGTENHTLNFELPAPSGIFASTNVDFRVDINPVAGETNTANNTGQVNNLTFVNRTTPTIYFTRINYTPAGAGLPNLADVQAGVGDAFVRGIYPVNDADPNLYRQGLFPTLSWFTDDGNNDIVDGTDIDSILDFLESCRQLIVNNGLGASNNTFLYGWIRDNPISGNGWAPVGGRVAFGNTQFSRHQRTFAHELTHNFGLNHNSNFLDQVGWDVGARLPSNPAGNNTTGRVKPTSLRDIMVGGQLTNSAWVDTGTYGFLNGSSVLAAGPDLPDFATRVAVIEGIFDPEGLELRELDPVFRFPWPSQPPELLRAASTSQDSYFVEIVDELGNLSLTPFVPLLGDDAELERFGAFTVMVPVDPSLAIASLRVIDAGDQTTFGSFERSEPPQVEIVFPERGSELGRSSNVAWKISDPDTPLDQMMAQVAYSPDGGTNWVPIAVDVPGDVGEISFDATSIQESSGEGVIAVFVSDGLNTESASVEGLTTLDAQFPAPSAAAGLALDPAVALNQVGSEHLLTAKVTDAAGAPAGGHKVVFQVTGVNPTTGSAETDPDGIATFAYTGTNTGGDTITAWVDDNGNEVQDAGEAAATGAKVWVLEVSNTLYLPVSLGSPNG